MPMSRAVIHLSLFIQRFTLKTIATSAYKHMLLDSLRNDHKALFEFVELNCSAEQNLNIYK